MADSYLGQILLFAGNYAPRGWLPCDGRTLAVSQYAGLYSIVGNYYGGGATTFNLPDLRGRVPLSVGQGNGTSNYTLGQNGGAENVTLQTAQIPAHNHNIQANDGSGNQPSPSGNYFAQTYDPSSLNTFNAYTDTLGSPVTMSGSTVSATGGSQGHTNLQPFLAMQWCICVEGIFPPRP